MTEIQVVENTLIPKPRLNPAIIFTDDGLDQTLEMIKKLALAEVPDVETDKGRKAIASLANKVARSKTAIDDLGKDANAERKKETDRINALRKRARDFLDPLKVEVRQLLTGYEAEQDRIKEEEAQKEKEKIQKRVADLAAIGVHMDFFDCATMPDEEFEAYYIVKNAAFNAEQKRIIEEEKEKQAKEADEKKAREAEDARLKKQKAEQDKKEADLKAAQKKLDDDKKAIQEQKKISRVAALNRIGLQFDGEDTFWFADIPDVRWSTVAAWSDAEFDASILSLSSIIETEKAAQKKKADEEKATEKAEAEAKAKAEQERIERLKPDKDKLIYWAESLTGSNLPFVPDHLKLESAEAQELLSATLGHLEIILAEMIEKAKEL